ncbi:MAG: hypothetical protein ACXVY6_03570 [Gaiellaceae bacterium]
MRGVAVAGVGLLLVVVAVIGWRLFGVWTPLTASLVGLLFLAVHREDHSISARTFGHTVHTQRPRRSDAQSRGAQQNRRNRAEKI